jgi:hypothetical protein
LPADWLACVHQATLEEDLDWVLTVIEQIRDQDENLTNALASLANNLKFEQLLALTQQ